MKHKIFEAHFNKQLKPLLNIQKTTTNKQKKQQQQEQLNLFKIFLLIHSVIPHNVSNSVNPIFHFHLVPLSTKGLSAAVLLLSLQHTDKHLSSIKS